MVGAQRGASPVVLGWTAGDPAGVGPELLLRALQAPTQGGLPWLYGGQRFWEGVQEDLLARQVVRARQRFVEVEEREAVVAAHARGDIPLRPWLGGDPPLLGAWPWGERHAWCGRWQWDALHAAIDDALAGRIDGMVTAPWHKARLADAGLPPTGHTEVLAARTGAEVVMLLCGDLLRVALVTTHIPLASVAAALTPAEVRRVVWALEEALRSLWGIARPRVAICGLNPHAGEEGKIGDEEQRWLGPLVRTLQEEGLDAVGPLPADTLFPMIVAGRLHADGVVAMYHDQGLAPLKTVHFGEAANVTLGLPFVRTSVDHGTAYDLAGRGEAELGSFLYASRLAVRLVKGRAGAA